MCGIDKPAQLIAGTSLLEHVVDAVADAGRIVVVGPERTLRQPVSWRCEDPPGAGPVAAVAAASDLIDADFVLLLAADLPDIAPAIPVLVASLAASEAVVAVLIDSGGQLNYLAAAWRLEALRTRLAVIANPTGAPMRALYRSATIVEVADPLQWGLDCDTWDDLAAARARRGQQTRPEEQ